MIQETRNPGDEAGAPKNIAFGGAKNIGVTYSKAAANSTPSVVADCPPFQTVGTLSRDVVVNTIALRWCISPALASVTVELAMLGRRAV